MSHNNICLDSVYVTSKGTWKIGEFQHCCKFLEVTPDFLKNSRPFRNEESISPEEKVIYQEETKGIAFSAHLCSIGLLIFFGKKKDDCFLLSLVFLCLLL